MTNDFKSFLFLTLCVAKRTLPNEPVPSVTPISKSERPIGVGRVLTVPDILLQRESVNVLYR